MVGNLDDRIGELRRKTRKLAECQAIGPSGAAEKMHALAQLSHDLARETWDLCQQFAHVPVFATRMQPKQALVLAAAAPRE